EPSSSPARSRRSRDRLWLLLQTIWWMWLWRWRRGRRRRMWRMQAQGTIAASLAQSCLAGSRCAPSRRRQPCGRGLRRDLRPHTLGHSQDSRLRLPEGRPQPRLPLQELLPGQRTHCCLPGSLQLRDVQPGSAAEDARRS
ncbi:hypothetical protein PFISCL1PPCAC_13354, partial [Pristionchus fissidentatus]